MHIFLGFFGNYDSTEVKTGQFLNDEDEDLQAHSKLSQLRILKFSVSLPLIPGCF